jgi:membrane-associated phospholipid phosphatase
LATNVMRWMHAFDQRVDRAFDRVRGRRRIDRMYYLASELGDYSLIWHLVGTARGLRSDHDADAAIRLAVVLLGEGLLVNQGVKRLVNRDRPIHETIRPHRLRTPRTSSFPSGHASAAFTAAGVLSDGDPLWPLYYGLAVIVATSRIHVRIHHGTDVVVGAALGVVLARLAKRLWPLRYRRRTSIQPFFRRPPQDASRKGKEWPVCRRGSTHHDFLRRDMGLPLPLRPQCP